MNAVAGHVSKRLNWASRRKYIYTKRLLWRDPNLIPGIYISNYFQNYLISVRINLSLFSTVLPSNSRLFLSYRPFVVITAFSTGLLGVEVTFVSWLGQLTVGV
jgi:hypothetical protein